MPAVLAAVGVLGFCFLPQAPALFSDKGLVNTVNGLLNTLIGFYIAALAAVAAFPSPTLDEVMQGRAPTIAIALGDSVTEEKLTRRRFLVILFGYCAFVSIMLFAMGTASTIIAPSIAKSHVALALKLPWLCLYFSMAASLFVTTLLGLHYLIDRMHRE